MRVDAPEPANAASAAVPSLYGLHPRCRTVVTGVAGVGPLPRVTVNHLNQGASGTLSHPRSRTAPGWVRGRKESSDPGNLVQCCERSVLAITCIANSCFSRSEPHWRHKFLTETVQSSDGRSLVHYTAGRGRIGENAWCIAAKPRRPSFRVKYHFHSCGRFGVEIGRVPPAFHSDQMPKEFTN